MLVRFACLSLALAASAGVSAQITPYRPSPEEVAANYTRAGQWASLTGQTTTQLTLDPTWISPTRLWYRRELGAGRSQYRLVLADKAKNEVAFDHERLAKAVGEFLGRTLDAERLPILNLVFSDDLQTLTFSNGEKRVKVDLKSYAVSEGQATPPPNRPQPRPRDTGVRVQDGQVQVREGETWKTVSQLGDYAAARRAESGGNILAFRLIPGDRKPVFLIESSPRGGGRAQLRQRLYDQPGDKLDLYEPVWISPAKGEEKKLPIAPIVGGGHPWSGPPDVTFWKSGKSVIFDHILRGYQEAQVHEVNLETGEAKLLFRDAYPTFFDSTKMVFRPLTQRNAFLWRSEQTGWGHLNLVDEQGKARPLTSGNWVVRSLEQVDEERGEVIFTASGREIGDPYNVHTYRVGLDGAGLKRLTEGTGMHRTAWDPENKYFVDSFSQVNVAPQHVLRSRDGKMVLPLEVADVTFLGQKGWKPAEPFVAKGRDGTTDIYGVVIKPSFFDPTKSYPVIENIYAGPHDNFVPKTFLGASRMHQLAELGFIVVQIDGMGTNNRGKAFHDIAWKNIADAGFPDRILWLQALAKKMPQADITRVGIYGTSAGGQSSTGGVLFHPDFYDVAVSSCGCHDNTMDKYWWNEQWMSYPVGEHYVTQSNITNAGRLKGKLMLLVGELDSNVPPESTYRLADALIKANKEFELVLLPGMDHTDGGAYGERKRRDFFVKHLLGVDPPNWNVR